MTRERDYPAPAVSTWPGTVGMGLCVAGAVIMFVLGWVAVESAIEQAAIWAGAAVFAIIARICQASVHHAKLMEEIRRG
jgi:hypothetical protein